eukprot:GHVP01047593.1.p1 GENE.GHVP01047593.1~~GHVP01047593.1.p1  ORF type:complete len:276 (+),score=32.61 GHVP01047593.1:829-1656(+)
MPVVIKTVKKSSITKLKQERNIKNETTIHQLLCHPFIANMYSAFEDEKSIHMVMEYVAGGELFNYLRNSVRFPIDSCRFYAAQIVMLFEYMHSEGYIYRDLKPENILLDLNGYLKVTDFGFAKKLDNRTYSLCGTPEYLAPEIIQGQGYGKSCDWWSLGILIYELISGAPPFVEDNTAGMYEKILKGNISFSTKYFDLRSKDLVRRLLTPNPEARLGCMEGGAFDVKNHSWFQNVNWNDILHRRCEPPYLPRVTYKYDTSNFDSYPESDDEKEEY